MSAIELFYFTPVSLRLRMQLSLSLPVDEYEFAY
jgi:hypothetical protein